MFNPSLAFAVNDRITLAGGLQWINKKEDRYKGTAQGFRRTSTDITLGFGYGVAKGNTLNFSFNTAALGQNRAESEIELALCLLIFPIYKDIEMKKIIFATILSGAITAPAMAASNTDLSNASSIFNVQDQQALQLEVLSSLEMKETEGAYLWQLAGAGFGGYAGHWGYMANSLSSNSYNFGSHMASISVGAAAGAWSPVTSIGRAAGTLGSSVGFGAFSGWSSTQFSNTYW